jgi:broad specificity phosphatase PhoE
MRHSIRPHIEIINGRHQDVSLTEEGKKIAYELGNSLEIPLGTISSSPHLRCKQTCIEIINGYLSKNFNQVISCKETKILKNSHVLDGKKTHQNFDKYGNEGLFKMYAEGKNIDGQNNLKDSVDLMLDYIFQIGKKSPSLDIFCTHDFQITLFLLYLLGSNQENQEKILSKWPQMMEGFFLYGERNHFTIIWRGEKKEIYL